MKLIVTAVLAGVLGAHGANRFSAIELDGLDQAARAWSE
jgi:hypothetical protein